MLVLPKISNVHKSKDAVVFVVGDAFVDVC